MFDGVYVSATRENQAGDVILKLVNVQSSPQPLSVDLQGVTTINRNASGEMITGELGAINTVAEPMKVIPQPIRLRMQGRSSLMSFRLTPLSVIRLKTR